MTTRYRSIFPQSQKATYVGNDNVDFILSLTQEQLVSGSVTLEGKLYVWTNAGSTTPVGPGARIYFDHLVGAHGLVRDVTVEFRSLGIMENFSAYPRYVKHEAVAQKAPESLGTETDNAIELRVASDAITAGLMEGITTADRYVPFSIKLRCCVNKATAPLPSSTTGDIRIRLRLAPNGEFLFGEDYVEGATNYQLTDLKMRFVTVPDAGKKDKALTMEVLQLYKGVLDSNNVNLSTFVPGLSRAVSMSFIRQSDENDPKTNYLLMSVPPGKAPYGASQDVDTGHYGLERLYYSINDTDTALVGFTLESREEIILNGLRVFNASPLKYDALIREFMNPEHTDCYLAGIPFGGTIDFSRSKFAAELQSQASSSVPLNAYLYFPTFVSL